MYLIDNSYFTGKYAISNILESNSGEGKLLTQFTDIGVRSFMQDLLGLELFTEFDSYMEDGSLKPDAPQKWLDLVNGVEYDGKKWNGLIYKIGEYKKSLLTNFIWVSFHIERNRIDGNGNANVIDTKNANLGNTANQYYPIWNEFVNLTTGLADSDFVSLNQFLVDKMVDYPTTNFVLIEHENRFL